MAKSKNKLINQNIYSEITNLEEQKNPADDFLYKKPRTSNAVEGEKRTKRVVLNFKPSIYQAMVDYAIKNELSMNAAYERAVANLLKIKI